MNRRQTLLAMGAASCILLALFMPTAWYAQLPRNPSVPLPNLSGVTLLRVLLLIEAAVFGVAALSRVTLSRIDAANLHRVGPDVGDPLDLSSRHAALALIGVTLIALALRVYHGGADLWIDELTPLAAYRSTPVLELIASYTSSNNHLLNTVLEKWMISLFGENEWTVRIPAVFFGVATIPLVYWCSRIVLTRTASIGAALLLATSYHHIFFSQNARGYSAYLFFALLATRALIDALRTDRLQSWVLYVTAVVLGAAALLNTAFVVAAHVIVVVIALWAIARRGGDARPLAKRATAVFCVAGLLSVQLYSVALPDVYMVMTHTYTQQSTGFVLLSGDFVREFWRGLAQGFGQGIVVAAIVALGAACAGFVALFRRSWTLALLLALPGVITALFLVIRGLTVSPRFFLLWLPLAAITTAVALDAVANFVWTARPHVRQRATTATVVILSLVSTLSLKRYYQVPKQPYRQALEYVEAQRAPDDLVVVVYLAEAGVRYYGAREHFPLESRYRFVRTVPALDSALAAPGHAHVWMISTFERALKMDLPEIARRLSHDYEQRARFDATIGDGSIGVWSERPGALSRSSAAN